MTLQTPLVMRKNKLSDFSFHVTVILGESRIVDIHINFVKLILQKKCGVKHITHQTMILN